MARGHFEAVSIQAEGDEAVTAALEEAAKLLRGTAADAQALAEACEAALAWVENMRIVPGGERDRLRRQLRAALGKPPP